MTSSGRGGTEPHPAEEDSLRLRLVEVHEQLAHDLLDEVTQRLFRVGLDLSCTAGMVGSADARARLADAVEQLDATIRHMRLAVWDNWTISGAKHSPGGGGGCGRQA